MTNLQTFGFYGFHTELNMNLNCNKTFYLWSILIPILLFRFLMPMILLIVTNFLTIRQVNISCPFFSYLLTKFSDKYCTQIHMNNIIFICQVRKLNNTLEELTETSVSRRTEIQLTKKIMSIIGVFFFCNSSVAILGMLPFGPNSQDLKIILVNIALILVVFQCGSNIIIYSIFDSKFRRTFLELFCSCSPTKKTSLKIFKHYKLKPSFSIMKDEKNKVGVGDKPPPPSFNDLIKFVPI